MMKQSGHAQAPLPLWHAAHSRVAVCFLAWLRIISDPTLDRFNAWLAHSQNILGVPSHTAGVA
eukprot:CAMPEP_0119560272 /NCGR_PEP_ID=MMETSP1352-20130426/14471_1 /TAXON_ID=265584 /ORGANISM="Stauroneis constricta, Strain CCMP1120" /LENGTH=62 /DNA_ID=CAMNT_0007608221 /DNA_START=238 /DNA_END=422 /DNA_ORIENTATION=-